MERLGYRNYGAQGGDWGARISWELGAQDREHVVGVHVNMMVAAAPDHPAEMARLDDEDRARLARRHRFHAELSGYMKIQATRPQTLAYALTDSPVGQLAGSSKSSRSGPTRSTHRKTPSIVIGC